MFTTAPVSKRRATHSSFLALTAVIKGVSLADPGFGQGGAPEIFFRDFADVVKQSQASEASQYWLGSRAHLRALDALAFLTVKYAFFHFSWYFFFKLFNVHLCG